jgi:hypothetical protein
MLVGSARHDLQINYIDFIKELYCLTFIYNQMVVINIYLSRISSTYNQSFNYLLWLVLGFINIEHLRFHFPLGEECDQRRVLLHSKYQCWATSFAAAQETVFQNLGQDVRLVRGRKSTPVRCHSQTPSGTHLIRPDQQQNNISFF